MEELLKAVSEKTGLPADKAQQAVEAVVEFLKDKLPGPIGDQISGFLEGGTSTATGAVSDLVDKGKGMLGGLLGGKDK